MAAPRSPTWPVAARSSPGSWLLPNAIRSRLFRPLRLRWGSSPDPGVAERDAVTGSAHAAGQHDVAGGHVVGHRRTRPDRGVGRRVLPGPGRAIPGPGVTECASTVIGTAEQHDGPVGRVVGHRRRGPVGRADGGGLHGPGRPVPGPGVTGYGPAV